MPKGKDTSRHPNRRVDNVVFGNFGHPMQNHPAFMASRGMLPKKVEGIDEPVDIMALKDLPSDHPVFQNQPKFPKAAYEVSEQDEVEMAKKRDDAPVHGIPRPTEYTKKGKEKNPSIEDVQRQVIARKVAEENSNLHKKTHVKTGDDAPVKGIPRPKLTKKEMED